MTLNPLDSIKTTVLTTSRDLLNDKDMAWIYLIVKDKIYKEQDLFNEYLDRFNWHSEKERLIQLNKNFQIVCHQEPSDLQVTSQALRDILDPISKMIRELKPNEQLNGTYTMKLSEDPNYLKSIAKNALEFMGEIQ